VQGTGRIVWFKKVIDRDTSEVLFDGTGVFLGGAYPGGNDGAFSVNTFIPLNTPSNNFTVFEVFILDIAGARRAWRGHGESAAGGAGLGA
jgi:hypothetical protein